MWGHDVLIKQWGRLKRQMMSHIFLNPKRKNSGATLIDKTSLNKEESANTFRALLSQSFEGIFIFDSKSKKLWKPIGDY